MSRDFQKDTISGDFVRVQHAAACHVKFTMVATVFCCLLMRETGGVSLCDMSNGSNAILLTDVHPEHDSQ